MGITGSATRRSVLAALPTLAAVVAPSAAVALGDPAEPDPVFAAIDAHKAAYETQAKAFAVYGYIQRHGGLHPIWRRALNAHMAALLKLLNTMPTTPAGVAVAMQHLGQVNHLKLEGKDLSRSMFLDRSDTANYAEWIDMPELVPALNTYLERLGTALQGMQEARS